MYLIRRIYLYGVLAIVISLGLCGIAVSDTIHDQHTIIGDENWYASGNTHYVRGNQYIEGSLTIHAGCRVEFYKDRTIKIKDGGSLLIDGVPGNWVTMCGRENPVTYKYERWEGITVDANATINLDVEYCNIWEAKRGIYVSGNISGPVSMINCYVYYHRDDKEVLEGIHISGLNGSVSLTDCYVCWRELHGIFLKNISGAVQVYDCSVANLVGENTRYHGIYTESCSNATISENYVQDCTGDGIHAWDLPPGNTTVRYNTIYNCDRGIWRGRGSAMTYNNEIYNCSEGIYTDDHGGYIYTNYIYVPSGGKGIHVLTDNPLLYNNDITWYQSGTNGGYGIYGGVNAGCSPYVTDNEIYHVNTGIYCGEHVVDGASFRRNTIQHCQTAIYTNGCKPYFGTISSPGNNSIALTNGLFFKAENAPQKVMAQMNWWGSKDPDPNKFWWNEKEVVYKPCLQAPPP